jgi:hypothetical protein
MNSIVLDIFERIAVEGSRIVIMNDKNTLGRREIKTSVRLILPLNLSKYAVSEGEKAIERFQTVKRIKQ